MFPLKYKILYTKLGIYYSRIHENWVSCSYSSVAHKSSHFVDRLIKYKQAICISIGLSYYMMLDAEHIEKKELYSFIVQRSLSGSTGFL
uniref:Uncharacterized protein n=1 Tax=Babesia bovis TaxID=5865 RepID=S6BN84_BABBO|nr:hypothetical protein [Babesia bovis]